MRKYSILALTDHSKHSAENSLYSIMAGASKHSRFYTVQVASRGTIKNQSFYKNPQHREIFTKVVDENFSYDSEGNFFESDLIMKDILDFDIILMRMPRPVSDEFLLSLDHILRDKVVVNRPSGIIECSNKAFLLNYPEECPPMKLCSSFDDILSFSQGQDIVLKPLREYGGKGILRINSDVVHDGDNTFPLLEGRETLHQEATKNGYLAMHFLKNVDQGDKRIIVVGGEIMASSLRLPKKGSWMCNVALGGTAVPAVADEYEIKIVQKINPLLSQKGIVIYGVDTLMGNNNRRMLSEINALSIGGFPQAEKQTNIPIIQFTLNKIIQLADSYYKR